MNNLSNIELIISTLSENEDFLMLKEDYNITEKDLKIIIEAITEEAIGLDNLGIIIQYEIWEIITINTINRFMTREYNIKTGKQIQKPKLYAKDCVRRSIAESSPINIPNIEYAYVNNPTHSIIKKK